MDKRISYAVQLAMLKRLLNNKVISVAEYKMIKQYLKDKYKIINVA
ncbi:hypothetical protein EDD65_1159 [Keratinibaculum paraultunense]|jgi:transcriptional regulator CtsR|uniref:SHOCT-like domain-containing protein n=1 Tax=Keratinibaculum paraultunense TaxID=1278232 RepID=A0A4R3KP82_9FIRM|nr:SHOCT domain-containing protein [Keratinibaculum paraultunense]NMB07895.1 hypothetical protein [Tissierellia bacterium]QQY79034.1 hypothetical protein JL105_07510 [Keratinibaculum paraultunense]TCS86388.1 hypothetical protein EDD65_1159 [Keratinibaculum paraultunense]